MAIGFERTATVNEGDTIPAVDLIASDGTPLALRDFVGAPLVVYFYPKDDTPGCTREAQDFSALADEFGVAGVKLLGVSKDSPAKHTKFIAKHALRVALATDADDAAMAAFGVWVEKSMYGKSYMGIERSTFLFDAQGDLVRAWRKVKVPGHTAAVLEAAGNLKE